ncbi:MAG TPA: Rieske 2Fe-2S domain-containing protein [Myxococcota bacterium]|nr:Rieske 2Fe-2S domain-containing protein [Myxococcota bacterium]
MPRFPFGIPNGWFLIAYSEDLPRGAVKRMRYLARELVAFRGASGAVSVLDAYCPHLGAHLGEGGVVVGDTVRCPFHGWRWDGQGACAEIPYAKRIPPAAHAEAFPTRERNGMVFVWHDAQRRAPSWEIPALPEWDDADWLTPWLRYEWTVKTHPQEMAENGVDWPHFASVHKTTMPDARGAEFGPHVYRWTVGASKGVSTLAGAHDELVMRGENWGLGYNFLRQTGRFRTVVATALTPIDAETTHMRMGVIAKRDGADAAVLLRKLRAYMDEHAVVATQDFAIWENKIFRARPALADGDGPIAEFRRWAAQFYG